MEMKPLPKEIRKAAVIFLLAVVLINILGFAMSSFDLRGANYSRSAQEECVEGFMSAVAARDDRAALEYVCNGSSLGLSGYIGDFQPLYDELFSGLNWEIEEISQLNSRSCEVQVDLSLISVCGIASDLSELTMEKRNEEFFSRKDYDQVITDGLKELLLKKNRYYIHTDYTFRLVFEDGRWKLVLDESFADVILKS